MKMMQINPDEERSVLLIHPMLSSAESMNQLLASRLGTAYRYLIPDLSGHGAASEQTYQSASEEAKAIHTYLQEQQITELQLAFGASLGGVILFELLRYPDLHFSHIFFEGVSFQENAPLLNFFYKTIFLHKHRKAVADPALAVRKMSAHYGSDAAVSMAKGFIDINEQSIRNIVYDCAFVALPELSEQVQSSCIFAFGERDSDLKRAKKIQPAKYPYAKLIVWKGYDHCARMSKDTQAYVQMLKAYL